MRILGIDSSGTVASAAVLEEDRVLAEFTVNNKLTHSQTLLPMIDETLRYAGVGLEELDAIATASGPGSFTGLRIGASTVKGLGLVLDKPIIPVPTLEGLAYQLPVEDGLVCPLMDARRHQVYTGIYRWRPDGLEIVMDQKALDIHELVAQLNTQKEKVYFLGDGVPVSLEVIRQELRTEYRLAPSYASRQRAAAVAVLGEIYYRRGSFQSAAEFRPVYLRKSQAEREREEKMTVHSQAEVE